MQINHFSSNIPDTDLPSPAEIGAQGAGGRPTVPGDGAPPRAPEDAGTSHVSVIDQDDLMVSVTQYVFCCFCRFGVYAS